MRISRCSFSGKCLPPSPGAGLPSTGGTASGAGGAPAGPKGRQSASHALAGHCPGTPAARSTSSRYWRSTCCVPGRRPTAGSRGGGPVAPTDTGRSLRHTAWAPDPRASPRVTGDPSQARCGERGRQCPLPRPGTNARAETGAFRSQDERKMHTPRCWQRWRPVWATQRAPGRGRCSGAGSPRPPHLPGSRASPWAGEGVRPDPGGLPHDTGSCTAFQSPSATHSLFQTRSRHLLLRGGHTPATFPGLSLPVAPVVGGARWDLRPPGGQC